VDPAVTAGEEGLDGPRPEKDGGRGPLVGLAQVRPRLGDLAWNFEMVRRTVGEAVSAGLDLLVFPELALTGYFLKDMVPEVALALDSGEIRELCRLSERISLVVGFVEASDDHRYYNAAIYLERGEVRHRHRKVYLPTYGLFDEYRYFARGDRFRAFDTRFGRAALAICEDLWHPSAPYILAMDGAQTLLCPSNSPMRGLGQAEGPDTALTWERLVRTYAQLFGQHVLYAHRVGFEDGINFWGGSMVVGPSGRLLARADQFDETVLTARLDPAEVRRERLSTPLLRDEDLDLTLAELARVQDGRRA
jgi:predicted amidohydrolase